MPDVHWWVTVFYQQIENGNVANQIYGFTIDYGKFILIKVIVQRKHITRFKRQLNDSFLTVKTLKW